MNVSLYIAKRYLFSKKSHNAINIISTVAVCGVSIATLATVCALSVLNGFQGLFATMFSTFDPELKITPVQGKVFDPTTDKFLELRTFPEIEELAETLEDNVMLSNKDRQVPAMMKGVSDNFGKLTQIDSVLFDGKFQLRDEINNLATLGIGVASDLGLNSGFIYPIDIYVPQRTGQVNLANPLASCNITYVYISGIFMIGQAAYDNHYMLVPIALARELLDYENEVSALEIKLKADANSEAVQKKIQQTIGADYRVKNRYEQQEAAFNMMNIEKWVIFLILSFILLIALFNIIGSLSLLMVDKRADTDTLRKLGATDQLISNIFLLEGWMISAFGALTGVILGVLICLGQQYFGWIKFGAAGAFAISTYPVRVQPQDLLAVVLTVLIIGFFTVSYTVKYLKK
ncbi:membrane protein [Bacteroidia bacterium]|nr:membrane protein [Bacteroidia bacterium]